MSFSSALSGALGGAWASSRAGSDEARSSAVASSAPPSPRSAHDGARSVVSSALGGFVPSNGHALATRGVSAESRTRCGESTDAESRSRCGESTDAARAPVDERAIGTAAANSLAAVATADKSVLDISRPMSSSHDRDSSRQEGRHEGCPAAIASDAAASANASDGPGSAPRQDARARAASLSGAVAAGTRTPDGGGAPAPVPAPVPAP